jgi:beta-glucuronidase
VLDTPEKHDACMNFFTRILEKARAIDTSRPFTYAMHVNVEDNPMGHLFDVVSINKYYGWYDYTGLLEESLPHFEAKLEGFHEAFGKPILITEFGADAVAGEHHLPEVMFSEEYQSKTIELQYEAIQDKPWFLGVHVWNFADFRVAQSLTRIIHNRKGVFTRSRQPKLAAHMLKRLWKETTPSHHEKA